MATHSSILVWEIPWTEEPGGATVPGLAKSQTGLSMYAKTCSHTHTHIVCWNQVTLIAYNRRGSGTEGQLVRQLRTKVWTLLGFRGSTETL